MSCVEVTFCGSKLYNIGDEDTMAKAISGIPGIEPFVISNGSTTNLHCRCEIWKDDFALYTIASGITQDSQKLALLLHIGGTEVKEIHRTVKDSQEKYDVVHKLDVHFTTKKNLSYERYSFKICKQKLDEYCSAHIARLKRIGETCEYENLNTEVKDHT